MLYHILDWLRDSVTGLNVFRYLTFRSMVAFIIALGLVVWLEPKFIAWVRSKKMGQPIREDGPQTHQVKQGTPTMGGLVVVLAIALATILLCDLSNIYIWITLFVTLSYGGLGFLDDARKILWKNSKGVSGRTKLAWQFSTAFIAVLMLMLFADGFSTTLTVPLFKNLVIDLGWWFLPFAAVVIVGSSNAVNLTDGLDGLVIGPVITVAFAYGVFAYVGGNAKIAEYLQIPYIVGSGDLAIFTASVVGAGLGFLWYNSYPAQVFMGDVGALSLGGAIGTVAVITKQELILLIAGGVFVIEALSVIVQVGSYKLRKKRVLLMAPIHHHFELKGLSEPKIIVRCWIISIVLALISLATLKLR